VHTCAKAYRITTISKLLPTMTTLLIEVADYPRTHDLHTNGYAMSTVKYWICYYRVVLMAQVSARNPFANPDEEYNTTRNWHDYENHLANMLEDMFEVFELKIHNTDFIRFSRDLVSIGL
jgi:hypothetical protein